MEAVSFDDALQQADHVIFDAMVQKAKILAEARKNTPRKDEWSKLLDRHGLSPRKAKTYIEIAESPRINDPAIRTHLRPDVDLAATGHIIAMQPATLDQWRNRYDRRTWNSVVDLRDFREKIEPTPRQLAKKERLEQEEKARAEQYRARRAAEEREKHRPVTLLDPVMGRMSPDSPRLTFTFVVEDEEGG